MEVLRSPDQRFARLSAYPYRARSLALDEDGELRLAYVAEGAHDSPAVLLLHGPPTWSYLWRRVIPMLVEGGCRVVAPDLVGFGRSDKPLRPRDHRLDRHAGWIAALIEVLELRQVTVVAHGAAASLALRLMIEEEGDPRDTDAEEGDAAPRRGRRSDDEATQPGGTSAVFTRAVGVCPLFAAPPVLADRQVSEIVAQGCAAPLSDAIRAGYDAPFPDDEQAFSLRAGLRAQPTFLSAWQEDMPPIDLPILAVAGDRDELADDPAASCGTGA